MEQIDLLRYAIETLEQMLLPYALVGSFASSTYGEPRFTQDIDIVLQIHARDIPRFCQYFPSPDFYYQEGGSEKHLRDITGILRISGNIVDRDYVANFAKQLGLAEIWEAVLNRLNPANPQGQSSE